ncbi:universal stress protein [Sphingomonas corticis]|jgi:nucleotide-binding universal stress UspA family protein|uniref:Universal stress protein n=1 Tax=Sphingomonas corticis TaxID=2722791 RepID=A0ABX1CXI6_9SPHN|nr:universal stress protein [Sphingomonas corticis]NJR80690.1 universal stress protein [Sphingomonas corticis]
MRSILLPLSDERQDRHALAVGTQLADFFGGHLTALLPLTDFASLPVPHHPLLAGWDGLVAESHAFAERREAEVRKLLRELQLLPQPGGEERADFTFQAIYGNDDAVVMDAALTHDLVVFARSDAEDPDKDLQVSPLLKCTIESAGRPVLITTGKLAQDWARTAAIAWNGSLEAAHAVTAALPLLSRAEAVHIVTFPTSRTDSARAQQLVDYLARHGITATPRIEDAEVPIGEALLEAVEDLAATVLVMGGYTHSRLRQTLFGGVTHHILEEARLPVLMAR